MKLAILLFCLLAACQVDANVKAVFAHFMVGNTGEYTVPDWENDMVLARDSSIDGFVLNMALGEKTNGESLANAFIAAGNLGSTFKLFFSFDYAANGLWPASQVISLIQQYSPHPAYFHRGSKPLVSTFEGPKASADWPGIKAATNCFFMPSWSSLGAEPAWALGPADGLFSWAAWPTGPSNMETFTDASYMDALNGAPYMMGVSPCFYTNMPGFRKNWLWRGDSLWFDRWINVLYLQPEYVQIITWNDFGESHYIGPLKDKAFEAFGRGKAPFNYASGKHHNAWRLLLPFLISLAKSGTASVTTENFVAWYRPHPKGACGTGGTTGNTASQLQQVFSPGEIVEDKVFFAAVLGSSATVSVTIGGVASPATWQYFPSNGVGLYRGSVDLNGRTGAVIVTVTRGGVNILSGTGDSITTSCNGGMQNWNPYVIGTLGRTIPPVVHTPLSELGCTSGFGKAKYGTLCEIACKYDYCPKGACTCTSIGAKLTKPPSKDLNGCPAPGGFDATYLGLCSFVCNYATCPSVCKLYPAAHTCTAPNPVAPPVPVCLSGFADGKFANLCSMSCKYGFCPPEVCTCTEAGTSGPSPLPTTGTVGSAAGEEDYGLCAWTCARGTCPSNLCTCSGSGCSGTSGPGGTFFERKFSTPTESMALKIVRRELGENCRLSDICTPQRDLATSSCAGGSYRIGWDSAGCRGAGWGKSICCPVGTGFSSENCKWRGLAAQGCNGQCEIGETSVVTSMWGNANMNCGRGELAYCCTAQKITQAKQGCYWTDCKTTSCRTDIGERSLATKNIDCPTNQRFEGRSKSEYCCPSSAKLNACQWKGVGVDCKDNRCDSDSVLIEKDDMGPFLTISQRRWDDTCEWGSQKSLCCKIRAPASPFIFDVKRLTCSPFYLCPDGQDCEVEDDPDNVERRSLGHPHGHSQFHDRSTISKRLTTMRSPRAIDPLIPVTYYPRAEFIRVMLSQGNQVLWFRTVRDCMDSGIVRSVVLTAAAVARFVHTEHILDKQTIMHFFDFLYTNTLFNAAVTSTLGFNPLSPVFINTVLNADTLPLGLVGMTTAAVRMRNPAKRLFEIIGSKANPTMMVLLDRGVNIIKGVMNSAMHVPLGRTEMKDRIINTISNSALPTDVWMGYLHDTVGMFSYLHQPEVVVKLRQIIADIGSELDIIESAIHLAGQGPVFLRRRWEHFITLYLEESARFARQYVLDMGQMAIRMYDLVHPPNYGPTVIALQNIMANTANGQMRWPGYN